MRESIYLYHLPMTDQELCCTYPVDSHTNSGDLEILLFIIDNFTHCRTSVD